ncbi:winged helix-turn-helix domain-containing protein [Granulicella sp. S156]|jgi:eukaryotic-like serine/threonine-protein kinase|uniref:winged helix-turn-helix domain-containing protein n=1 Tax=Granulicella sp. S156 TaxID=1747224 RepID=UPI00131B9783|nr:winged helix-turn-helix domain-containing protein [Granulicella sp. S156]
MAETAGWLESKEDSLREVDSYLFDGFEVKVRLGLLLKDGEKTRIQRLPFQALLVLLEEPGRVVSQETLQARLWSDKTFMDFDSSLRVAMRKLRDALQDSASDPHYIRTIAGRGYQFIGQVTPVRLTSEKVSVRVGVVPSRPLSANLDVHSVDTTPKRRFPASLWTPRLRRISIGALILAVLAIAASVYYRRSAAASLVSDHDSVMDGGFANASGEADFSGVLSPAFQVKLEESPYLRLIDESAFRRLVPDLSSANLEDELRACSTLKGKILLRGEVQNQQPGYLVQVKVWKCGSGRLLATQESYAPAQEDVLTALNAVTEKLRRQLGEPEPSLRRFNVPVAQATTSSLAALKAFTIGEESRRRGQISNAIPYYELAIKLDPQFALAYGRLGAIYIGFDNRSLGVQYYKKAFDLRARTTDRERLYIAAHNDTYVTGDLPSSVRTYQVWLSIYPHDPVPMNNLAVEYLDIGEPQKALTLALEATKWQPDSSMFQGTLAWAHLALGDYGTLSRLCNSSPQSVRDSEFFRRVCFANLLSMNHGVLPPDLLRQASTEPIDDWLVEELACRYAYRGQLRESARYFSLAEHANNSLRGVSVRIDWATLEADLGLPQQAIHDTMQAVAMAPNDAYLQSVASLALARAGDTAHSEALAHRSALQNSSNTIVNSVILASANATIALKQHNPDEALRRLAAARPYDFCAATILSPPYYRGLIYMQKHQYAQAASEFQRVLEHRMLRPQSPYISLAMLELGRTQALSGNRAEASRQFAELDGIWKDADSDFPPMRQLRLYEHELY